MSAIVILQLLDTILMLASAIPSLLQKAGALKAEIQQIVAEGREPTEAEWESAKEQTDVMVDTLQNRAKDAQVFLDTQAKAARAKT